MALWAWLQFCVVVEVDRTMFAGGKGYFRWGLEFYGGHITQIRYLYRARVDVDNIQVALQ